MASRYERPEVKQVTKQWVRENCKNITERDMGLLRLLQTRRLLRRDQIQKLYPEFASTDRLNKRIKTLYNLHVVDKVYPPVGLYQGSSQQHICLDRAGIILLGLEKYNKPISTDSHGGKHLPLGWEHRVLINEYECRLRSFAESIGASILDYKVEESWKYSDTRLIPDIFCLIKYNGKGFPLIIEVDLGTEDIPYIKNKIDNYHKYYMSKEWMSLDWSSRFKNPSFPRILFVTEDKGKRISTLSDYTKDSLLRFSFDSHSRFEDRLHSIFQPQV